MKIMKNFNIAIFIIVFLVLVGVFSYSFSFNTDQIITGNIAGKSQCTDSDGGKDILTRGTVKLLTNSNKLYADTCLDNRYLKEYYCSGDKISYGVYDCPSFGKPCVNGACEKSLESEAFVKGFVGGLIELTNTNLKQQGCLELIPGHNKVEEDRANIVIVTSNVPSDKILNLAYSMIDYDTSILDSQPLLSLEPFKFNKNKFNFWYVNKVYDYNFPWTSPDKGGQVSAIPGQVRNLHRMAEPCSLPNKYIAGLYNSPEVSSFGEGVGSLFSSSPIFGLKINLRTGYLQNAQFMFQHEFGHAFANFLDEYVYRGSFNKDALDDTDFKYWSTLSKNCYVRDSPNFFQRMPWSNLMGNGCGQDHVIDCVDHYEVDYDDGSQRLTCNVNSDEDKTWCPYEITFYYEGCSYGKNSYRPQFNAKMRKHWEKFSYGVFENKLIQSKLDSFGRQSQILPTGRAVLNQDSPSNLSITNDLKNKMAMDIETLDNFNDRFLGTLVSGKLIQVFFNNEKGKIVLGGIGSKSGFYFSPKQVIIPEYELLLYSKDNQIIYTQKFSFSKIILNDEVVEDKEGYKLTSAGPVRLDESFAELILPCFNNAKKLVIKSKDGKEVLSTNIVALCKQDVSKGLADVQSSKIIPVKQDTQQIQQVKEIQPVESTSVTSPIKRIVSRIFSK